MIDLIYLRDRLPEAAARLGARNAAAARALEDCARVDTDWRRLVTEIEQLKSGHNVANTAMADLKKRGANDEFNAAREAGKARGARIKDLEVHG